MRLVVIPVAAAVAAACTPSGMPTFKDTLAQEVAGRTAGKAQSCVSPFGQQNLRVVNPQMIAYGNGSTVYVNRLRSPCPALEPSNTIIVETHGGQYCSGDHVRGLEPGATIPGPVCILGDWTPYKAP